MPAMPAILLPLLVPPVLIATSLLGLNPIAVVAIIVGPLSLLWSLNTLFALGLAYSMENWVAMLLLAVTLAARSKN